jgi:hypothetical protein
MVDEVALTPFFADIGAVVEGDELPAVFFGEVVVVDDGDVCKKVLRIALGDGNPGGGWEALSPPKTHPSTLPLLGLRFAAPSGL